VKLTRLDKRALRIINDAYPVPYDPTSDRDRIVEERPYLLPAEEVHAKCTATLNEVRDAITKLCHFQLVEPVYLFGPGEYGDMQTVGRRTFRSFPLPMSVDQPRTGRDTFQVTQRGHELLNTFPIESVKRFGRKMLEEKGPKAMWALAGIVFGWVAKIASGWLGVTLN
jgi:hypothetical protein